MRRWEAMTLRFSNLRRPTRFDELDPIQRAQLEVCARLYFGKEEAVPIAERLGGDGEDPEAEFCFVELWDVEADDGRRYDAFLYNVDSGTVFRRGTTEVVAEMIQCYFDQADDEQFEAALQVGYRAACQERKAAAGKTGGKKAGGTIGKRAGEKKAAAVKQAAGGKIGKRAAAVKKVGKKAAGKKVGEKKAGKKAAAKKAVAKKTAVGKKTAGKTAAAKKAGK